MSRLLPRSLFGQTLAIVLVGLAVSYAVGAWYYGSDREQAVRAVGGLAAAQRIANLTRLIDEAPEDWRPRLIEALNDRFFRVTLLRSQPDFPADEERTPVAEAVHDFVASQLPNRFDGRLHVAVAAVPNLTDLPPGRRWRGGAGNGLGGGFGAMRGGTTMMGDAEPSMMAMHRGFRSAQGPWRGLRAAVLLGDGDWLTFTTQLPESASPLSSGFLLPLALMGLVVLIASVWAVRRVTAPLGTLAEAAERLGRDVDAAPLAEAGSTEMRRAAHAFNRMQEQVKRLIENRTLMLAAISHDLRTPLTLLRLRAEGVETAEDRERMLSTISDMNAMLGATLSFARDEATAEPRRAVDLSALLASLADDMADAGLPVSMGTAPPVTCECRPQSLRRALTNLIDNAIKYGGKADIGLARTADGVEITVDDAGPGIAEAELSRVVQPFYRVEGSRSRATGGIGLGLAIAHSVVETHGGRLILSNRPEGGLRVRVVLPL